ncbi:MAG: dTDP-4-dehydrorhamnose 3,5-epimerase [Methylotenera sp.]
MQRFDCFDLPLAGLKIVQRKPIEDERGFLSRFYCAKEFANYGFDKSISQINHTLTRNKGAVRGLHYQRPPHAEIKLVSCIKGEIFDVVVDLRKDSPTFLQWHGEVLSAHNRRSLLIPEGFAHGFQTLCEGCELIYLHSAPYCKDAEAALNVIDPKIGITWPLEITELSERDRSHPMIKNDFEGIVV